jgi:DNA-binding NarL/FixJ family response regulator
MPRDIRVQVVAASAIARAGIEALLAAEPAFSLAGSLDAFPEPGGADVVVLDVERPDDDVLNEIAAAPGRVVLLADDPPPEWVRDAVRAGARGVLARQATQDELVAAVQAAAAGLLVLDQPGLEAAMQAPRPSPAGSELLTPREIEVLRMLAEGNGNKTIAWKLGISEHTVKFHVASIMGKLGAGSRTEAVAIGIRRGWIML